MCNKTLAEFYRIAVYRVLEPRGEESQIGKERKPLRAQAAACNEGKERRSKPWKSQQLLVIHQHTRGKATQVGHKREACRMNGERGVEEIPNVR